jgi:hypothetical protein
MTVHAKVMSSSPTLPESVRYYIERNPGNILIPLIPVDQLPFQPEGVPSQLSKQHVSEENWQRVTGVTEAAIVLPVQLILPVTITPIYRAPDYNVKQDAAVQVLEKDGVPEICPASTYSTMSGEQQESKQQQSAYNDANTHSTHVSINTKPIPIVERSRVTMTGTYGDEPNEPLFQTKANKQHVVLQDAPLSDVRKDIVARVAGNHTAFKLDTESSRRLYSRVDKGQFPADASDGDKHRFPGPQAVSAHPNWRPKVYCNYWIRTGECAWGKDVCKFKHEMPPLDILKKETGFHTIPQWYKEQTAIHRSRGPTWIERTVQAQTQDVGHNDGMEIPGLREFPDPSTLRNPRREKNDVVKHDMNSKRVVQDLIDLNLPTLPVNPIAPVEPGLAVAQVLSPIIIPTRKKKIDATALRRNSQNSWASDTTSITSSLSIKEQSKNKPPFKKAKQNFTPRPKLGLAASKYAPTENEPVVANCRCTTNTKDRTCCQNEKSISEQDNLTANAGIDQRTTSETALL